MSRHLHFQTLCLVLSFCFFCPLSFAQDSESDREKIVSAKARRFYNTNTINESLLLAGNYDSDHNSKEYHFDVRYYYRSQKQMHELYLFHENKYANSSSFDLEKKSERYDGTISSKFRIAQSNNYAALYGRADYDDLSDYYYDLRSAAGLGRLFFDGKLEFDTSLGYTDIKNYGSKIFIVPSVRLNLKLTKNMSLTQRGYFFFDREGMDNDLRTRIKYKISKKVYVVLSHTYEQRRYADEKKLQNVNQVRRYISLGLAFDLD